MKRLARPVRRHVLPIALGLAALFSGCQSLPREHSQESVKALIEKRLPLGSARAEAWSLLRELGAEPWELRERSDGSMRCHLPADGFLRLVAVEMQFDDADRLVDYSVDEWSDGL